MAQKYEGLLREFKTIIFEYHELSEDCCLNVLEKFISENGFNYKTLSSFIQINN